MLCCAAPCCAALSQQCCLVPVMATLLLPLWCWTALGPRFARRTLRHTTPRPAPPHALCPPDQLLRGGLCGRGHPAAERQDAGGGEDHAEERAHQGGRTGMGRDKSGGWLCGWCRLPGSVGIVGGQRCVCVWCVVCSQWAVEVWAGGLVRARARLQAWHCFVRSRHSVKGLASCGCKAAAARGGPGLVCKPGACCPPAASAAAAVHHAAAHQPVHGRGQQQPQEPVAGGREGRAGCPCGVGGSAACIARVTGVAGRVGPVGQHLRRPEPCAHEDV